MGNWRVFLAGMFCGTLLQMAVIGGFWWKSAYGHTDLQEDWIVVRSAEDEELYDRCLADSGNIVACDATMRLLDRYRAAENAEMTSIKSEVTKMDAAGVEVRGGEMGVRKGFGRFSSRPSIKYPRKPFFHM